MIAAAGKRTSHNLCWTNGEYFLFILWEIINYLFADSMLPRLPYTQTWGLSITDPMFMPVNYLISNWYVVLCSVVVDLHALSDRIFPAFATFCYCCWLLFYYSIVNWFSVNCMTACVCVCGWAWVLGAMTWWRDDAMMWTISSIRVRTYMQFIATHLLFTNRTGTIAH